MRFLTVWLTIGGAIALLFGSGTAWGDTRPARPHVLVIVADDLGWRDLGATGSDFYQTPHIDSLFDRGTRFERAYASCQVCSPSRASLLTGQAPPRHGITDYLGADGPQTWRRNTKLLPAPMASHLPHAPTTLAECFSAAGYVTFFAGKWHLGGAGSLPTDHGFDINVGGYHAGHPANGFFSPYKNSSLPDGPPGESLPLRLGVETARFIETHAAASADAATAKPFFALLSFYSVHSPIQCTQARWAKYQRLATASAPAGPLSRFLIDRTLPVRQRQDHPVYAGMVEAMDDAVGLVLAALSAQGLSEQTIVVFTSDNGGVASGDGYATANLPLRGGKGRQWEGGLRVPLVIALPGVVPAAQRIATPALHSDLYRTLTDLAQLPPSAVANRTDTDSVSLVPSMRGAPAAPRPLYWHYPHYGNQGGEPSSIVQRGTWKLIRYHEDGREELYDLSQDRGEQQNLALGQPQRVAELGALLDTWLAETGARQPTANPRYDAALAERERHNIRVRELPRLEEQAERFLQADYQPNPTWWGSQAAAE
ncbi:sulfatase [Botrimarina hoheduenensis]|uniref:Arylsulfatase n=1 Tax=Botrimarina hoheduenensis TaxID=2528000 RepID=A0A5C5W9H5_9BACT|nr:sulfatase [Botrimarina hoheduenensis]TWT46845.1 Arylsulfatase [Botrimarina hoheduenensis]